MNFNIESLTLHPERLVQLAEWHHNEWGYLNPGKSVQERIEKMRVHLQDDAVPATYVALSGDTLLGSAALVHSDMDSNPQLGPWLASVFVAPAFRRQGVGAALVEHVVAQAKDSGISVLYLFTPNQAQFYQGLGWQIFSCEIYRGTQVTVMEYNLL